MGAVSVVVAAVIASSAKSLQSAVLVVEREMDRKVLTLSRYTYHLVYLQSIECRVYPVNLSCTSLCRDHLANCIC